MKYTVKDFTKFKDSLEKLEDLKNSTQCNSENIHKLKDELQKIKTDLLDSLINNITFLRDENTLIISAPNIVIGNVDRSGILKPGSGSIVTIIGNEVNLNGVSGDDTDGKICSKATQIHQLAVNPGIDGVEMDVQDGSEIISKAAGIRLEAEDTKGFFLTPPAPGVGIALSTDKLITLDANRGKKTTEKRLKNLKEIQERQIDSSKDKIKDYKGTINTTLTNLKVYEQKDDKLTGHHLNIRLSRKDIDKTKMTFETEAQSGYQQMINEYKAVSQMVDSLRIKKAIEAEEKEVDGQNSPQIVLSSKNLNLSSEDGDGNTCTKDGAGIHMRGKEVNIESEIKVSADPKKKEGNENEFIKNSFLKIHVPCVEIDTSKYEYNEQNKINKTKAEEGKVIITSGSTTIQSIDRNLQGNDLKEEALPNEGTYTVRVANTIFDATTTEDHKATGKFKVNAQKLALRSVDGNVDHNGKFKSEKVAKNSQVAIVSDNIFVGSAKKDFESTLVQIYGDKTNIYGNTYTTISQSNKVFITFNSGKISVSGKTSFYDIIRLENDAVFLQEATMQTVKAEAIDVKVKFSAAKTLSAGVGAVPPKPKKKIDEGEKAITEKDTD